MLGKDKLDKLAETSFDLMEEEVGDTAFVGTALLMVEVRDSDGMTAFYTFCTDKRAWVQRAMVNEALVAVEFEQVEADSDD